MPSGERRGPAPIWRYPTDASRHDLPDATLPIRSSPSVFAVSVRRKVARNRSALGPRLLLRDLLRQVPSELGQRQRRMRLWPRGGDAARAARFDVDVDAADVAARRELAAGERRPEEVDGAVVAEGVGVACVVMALCSCGPCSYGLGSSGICSYDLDSYGLCSHVLLSIGLYSYSLYNHDPYSNGPGLRSSDV